MSRRRPLGACYPLTDDCQRVGGFPIVCWLILLSQLQIYSEMENRRVPADYRSQEKQLAELLSTMAGDGAQCRCMNAR